MFGTLENWSQRPHFMLSMTSSTSHILNQKALKLSSTSDEMLEGSDIRKVKIASKYQTETSETCVPKHKDVEVLIDFG